MEGQSEGCVSRAELHLIFVNIFFSQLQEENQEPVSAHNDPVSTHDDPVSAHKDPVSAHKDLLSSFLAWCGESGIHLNPKVSLCVLMSSLCWVSFPSNQCPCVPRCPSAWRGRWRSTGCSPARIFQLEKLCLPSPAPLCCRNTQLGSGKCWRKVRRAE